MTQFFKTKRRSAKNENSVRDLNTFEALNAGKFETKTTHWRPQNKKKEAQQKGENRWHSTLALRKRKNVIINSNQQQWLEAFFYFQISPPPRKNSQKIIWILQRTFSFSPPRQQVKTKFFSAFSGLLFPFACIRLRV